MHLNIRSLPVHFTELLCYLDTLDIEFKIIALSETAINCFHSSYTIRGYNCEIDYRSKRKDGEVSLYMATSLSVHWVLYTECTDRDSHFHTSIPSVQIDTRKVGGVLSGSTRPEVRL